MVPGRNWFLGMLERRNGSHAKARVILGSFRVTSLTDMSAVQEPNIIIIINYDGDSYLSMELGIMMMKMVVMVIKLVMVLMMM